MTHNIFERAYRRWKSTLRAANQVKKSISESSGHHSQSHQADVMLVESSDPRYKARSGSEYKISFLLGEEEAIATGPSRLRYTLVSGDEEGASSDTPLQSSTATDKPKGVLHRKSSAHRQLRHGSKERVHGHCSPDGSFSAKARTLIKRKPPVSSTNIGLATLEREPRPTGHLSSTTHEDVTIHTQRTTTQMHDDLHQNQQSQILHSPSGTSPDYTRGLEALAEAQDRQRLRQAASYGRLQRRRQRSSTCILHVSFLDAEDDESSIATQSTVVTHEVTPTMPDSYPFNIRHTHGSGSEQGREETWKDSFQGMPRLPQQLPPICPPPVASEDDPAHQHHADFKAHFFRLRDRTDPVIETPNLFTETSKCLEHLPEDIQEVYAKQLWPSKTLTNAESPQAKHNHLLQIPRLFSHEHTNSDDEHPTSPPPLFHHEHTVLDDDLASGHFGIKRTHTNLDYASKMREKEGEASDARSFPLKLVDVPLKKLRKVFCNGALWKSYTQARSGP